MRSLSEVGFEFEVEDEGAKDSRLAAYRKRKFKSNVFISEDELNKQKNYEDDDVSKQIKVTDDKEINENDLDPSMMTRGFPDEGNLKLNTALLNNDLHEILSEVGFEFEVEDESAKDSRLAAYRKRKVSKVMSSSPEDELNKQKNYEDDDVSKQIKSNR